MTFDEWSNLSARERAAVIAHEEAHMHHAALRGVKYEGSVIMMGKIEEAREGIRLMEELVRVISEARPRYHPDTVLLADKVLNALRQRLAGLEKEEGDE